ncbi:MAG: pyridoxamine 5'-phosphate oxidase family protein [Pacificimonas sp.]
MHTPVVATGEPDARVMVLRAFDQEKWQFRFHSDARSPKIMALAKDPAVAVLFYDADAKVQIRVQGSARSEVTSAEADQAWAAASNFARRCYLVENAPGTKTASAASGLPADIEGQQPDDADLIPARENFAIILIDIESMDWLYLANDGHRRAQFTRDDDGAWQGSFVIP